MKHVLSARRRESESSAPTQDVISRSSGPVEIINYLQRTAGNLAVSRLIGSGILQTQRRREKPSEIIPDLDAETFNELKNLISKMVSPPMRQELIQKIVDDRKNKNMDTSKMEKGYPQYAVSYPAILRIEGSSPNGMTVPPGTKDINPGQKPLVLIGPTAFGDATVPDEERVVRVYSSIMHEYQHVLQWQDVRKAAAMGKAQREVDAFFWEIENSKNTGLYKQPAPLKHVWDTAQNYWREFQNSPEWKNMEETRKIGYTDWDKRVSNIVSAEIK